MHKSQRSSKDHKHRHMLHPVVRGINTEVAGSSTSSIDCERVAFSNIMQEASAQAVLHMAKKKHRWTEHSQAFSIRRKLLYNTIRYANRGQQHKTYGSSVLPYKSVGWRTLNQTFLAITCLRTQLDWFESERGFSIRDNELSICMKRLQ